MTQSPTRRDFLRHSLAAGVALPVLGAAWPAAAPGAAPLPGPAVDPAPEKLRILFLGGTGFLGPATVEVALARGHAVTLFNRGKTRPELFPAANKLRGDRNQGELDALKGHDFDAVVDLSGYVPGHVAATAGLLADHARQYIFISSVSVYAAFGESSAPVSEQSPLATVAPDVVAGVKTMRESIPHYGAMKALCEKAAEEAMPGRVANIRPGLIVGPRDPSDRFTWWPVRVDRGGEVLAPGDPDGLVQFVDVRDLGAWLVRCVEENTTGVYNAVGLNGPLSMAEFLHGCKCATVTPCRFTWVSEEFLEAQKIRAWTQLPMWLPAKVRGPIANAAAIAQGLVFRPAADTIRDTLAWAKTERGTKPFRQTGLPAEREKAALEAWAAKNPGR
ncbi:MAG: NAD-dependent epimerase/dehydratase family protein [Planctomycetes bacterium]|nr:NAD-dependent epimerase/dehydratase family protein [Planctomycetota bacterium]